MSFFIGRTMRLVAKEDEEAIQEIVRAIEREITRIQNASVEAGVVPGANGSSIRRQTATEEILVPVGSGLGGVDSLSQLVPAGCNIAGAAAFVTVAPGGGASVFNLGRKSAGNADELVQTASCVNRGDAADSFSDNDGTQLPLLNQTADKLTIFTDANVTVSDMKIRVVVWYDTITPPTA